MGKDCIGWLGKIFGHKFSTIDSFHNNCQRCGMPKGGWPQLKAVK